MRGVLLLQLHRPWVPSTARTAVKQIVSSAGLSDLACDFI